LLPLMKWVIALHVILDKVELVSLLGDLLRTLALGRWIYLMYSLNRTLLPQLRVS